MKKDESVRLLKLRIPRSAFLSRQLLIQEAPDLCYQKLLADLKSGSLFPDQDVLEITDPDISAFRDSHPLGKDKRKYGKKTAINPDRKENPDPIDQPS
jgi:hypothetical protein